MYSKGIELECELNDTATQLLMPLTNRLTNRLT